MFSSLFGLSCYYKAVCQKQQTFLLSNELRILITKLHWQSIGWNIIIVAWIAFNKFPLHQIIFQRLFNYWTNSCSSRYVNFIFNSKNRWTVFLILFHSYASHTNYSKSIWIISIISKAFISGWLRIMPLIYLIISTRQAWAADERSKNVKNNLISLPLLLFGITMGNSFK